MLGLLPCEPLTIPLPPVRPGLSRSQDGPLGFLSSRPSTLHPPGLPLSSGSGPESSRRPPGTTSLAAPPSSVPPEGLALSLLCPMPTWLPQPLQGFAQGPWQPGLPRLLGKHHRHWPSPPPPTPAFFPATASGTPAQNRCLIPRLPAQSGTWPTQALSIRGHPCVSGT